MYLIARPSAILSLRETGLGDGVVRGQDWYHRKLACYSYSLTCWFHKPQSLSSGNNVPKVGTMIPPGSSHTVLREMKSSVNSYTHRDGDGAGGRANTMERPREVGLRGCFMDTP